MTKKPEEAEIPAKKKLPDPTELTGEQINLESSTEVVEIQIESAAPILPHRFSEKAKRIMADKHSKKEKKGREIRDPVQEAVDALYIVGKRPEVPANLRNYSMDNMEEMLPLPFLKGCTFGLPPAAFKHAVARVGKTSGFMMTDLAATLFVLPHVQDNGRSLVVMEFNGVPMMRCDPVTVGQTTDLRYRCEIHPWRTTLQVRYNAGFIGIRQLAKLFADAGEMIGISDWRPERFGEHGRFTVKHMRKLEQKPR